MARLLFITFSTVLFASIYIDAASDQIKTNESTENATDAPAIGCKDNEIQVDCHVDCPSDYCPRSRSEDQSACLKPVKCPPPTCICQFNYRRAINGSCIPTRDCPPFACDGPHESYNSCPSYCPGENCSQATPDGECHLLGVGIVVNCQPACRCDKTYWRLNGTCVAYDECPK